MTQHQLALRQTGHGDAQVEECLIPEPEKDEALVRISAVSLNPFDWKMLYRQNTLPAQPVLGCDFAGTVERVGVNVKNVMIGDRVAGTVYGGNIQTPDNGAFSEYVAASAHMLLHLPTHISFEDASTLPTPLFTAGYCLYKQLSLSYPGEATDDQQDRPPLLIYGGATAIGSMMIQLAKLSGHRVLTVCSGASFELVRNYGADMAVDYLELSSVESLIEVCRKEKPRYTIDCISNADSARICASAMQEQGGFYISCTANGPAIDNPQVKTIKIFAFAMLGHESPFPLTGSMSSSLREDVDFGTEFTARAETLLREDKIKPIAADIRQGGLQGIVSGLRDLKASKVGGRRLVYEV
ncbi:hypothetical protein LTR10_015483 [Elasticomyces elasticus]|uniref:Enoyl reductase (ER) domain-containing protein n=1 Tax=Exophiala sideris TaxID=1016849 RepID=A0ABR0J3Y3_9EURO|nr:hypothetical protein LTR10_015483 [Elasticomyces elasticus]KAK5026925.1 hypothetical protein LTS07_007224 [Exophiala sideris]KAK5033929.1 hypothetical protein LTR13_006529 [Exophiala sideris]KAK5055796.1 hypothetical protein LTR69_008171 [Exophiala sideris]KAK5180871.1 hypothetical protein LTR44_006691 [Eurotiomycetes sp. CCFEE 6388]